MHLTGRNTAQNIKVKGDAVSTMGFDITPWQNKLLTAEGLLLWHNLLHCIMLTDKFSPWQRDYLRVVAH